VVLPIFASRLYREASAKVVLSGCELFQRSYEWVLGTDRAVMNPEMTVSAAELVYSYNVAAGFEATMRLRREAGSRGTLEEDTKGEIWALKILTGFLRRSRATIPTQQLVELKDEVEHLQHSAAVLFATAAGTLVSEEMQRLAREELEEAVKDLMQEICSQRDALAECIRSGKEVDVSSLGPLTKTTELDERFARLRERLIGTAEHKQALQGGLLRIYAYLYTVAEFSEAWSSLVNAVVPAQAIFRHITAAELAGSRRRSSTYRSV
jgi:hypothetical protein